MSKKFKELENTFEAFCIEFKIEEAMKPAVRKVFYSGALAMFVILKGGKKIDMLTRILVSEEIKEFKENG